MLKITGYLIVLITLSLWLEDRVIKRESSAVSAVIASAWIDPVKLFQIFFAPSVIGFLIDVAHHLQQVGNEQLWVALDRLQQHQDLFPPPDFFRAVCQQQVQARPENRGADQQLAFEGRLRPIVGSQPLMLTAASRSPAQRTDRERSIADIARASSPAVVLIVTFDGSNNPVAHGSGFVCESVHRHYFDMGSTGVSRSRPSIS